MDFASEVLFTKNHYSQRKNHLW